MVHARLSREKQRQHFPSASNRYFSVIIHHFNELFDPYVSLKLCFSLQCERKTLAFQKGKRENLEKIESMPLTLFSCFCNKSYKRNAQYPLPNRPL
jgi:hypothetical protein